MASKIRSQPAGLAWLTLVRHPAKVRVLNWVYAVRLTHFIQRKEESMRKQRILGICLCICILLLGASVYAQMVRPTHPGTVWELSFIHVKPGMAPAYNKYLASD